MKLTSFLLAFTLVSTSALPAFADGEFNKLITPADRQRMETVSGHEFIRRFLQHVLPAGFHKVRYYGLWHASRREPLCNLKNVLLLAQPASPPAEPAAPEPDADPQAPPSPRHCPHCKTGHLTLLRRLSPARPQGPW